MKWGFAPVDYYKFVVNRASPEQSYALKGLRPLKISFANVEGFALRISKAYWLGKPSLIRLLKFGASPRGLAS